MCSSLVIVINLFSNTRIFHHFRVVSTSNPDCKVTANFSVSYESLEIENFYVGGLLGVCSTYRLGMHFLYSWMHAASEPTLIYTSQYRPLNVTASPLMNPFWRHPVGSVDMWNFTFLQTRRLQSF
jgi:hypothetical protein